MPHGTREGQFWNLRPVGRVLHVLSWVRRARGRQDKQNAKGDSEGKILTS